MRKKIRYLARNFRQNKNYGQEIKKVSVVKYVIDDLLEVKKGTNDFEVKMIHALQNDLKFDSIFSTVSFGRFACFINFRDFFVINFHSALNSSA